MRIKISDIKIGERLREIDEEKVRELANSIVELGLIHPITVEKDDDGYNLVAGAHRLEACKMLGCKEIDVDVKDFVSKYGPNSEWYKRRTEIDENLIRSLTTFDRAILLKERKRMYEHSHSETKHGGDRNSMGFDDKEENQNEIISPTFSKLYSEKLGLSERTIQQEVQIAESLCSKAKKLIKGSRLEGEKVMLMKISKLEPAEQQTVITYLKHNSDWTYDRALCRLREIDYGFKVDETGQIVLRDCTLHQFNNGLPVQLQKEIIRGLMEDKYPPFTMYSIWGRNDEQDELIMEVKREFEEDEKEGASESQSESKDENDEKIEATLREEAEKHEQEQEAAAQPRSYTAQEIMEMPDEELERQEKIREFEKAELKSAGVRVPKRNDGQQIPVLVLPDGKQRVFSNLASEGRFHSGSVLREILERIDLPENESILIRRVGNFVSVSRASVNSERFIEQIQKAYEQIALMERAR